jgi:hypothetical protein
MGMTLMKIMRGAGVMVAGVAVFALAAHTFRASTQATAPEGARVPVLVELFTSEGCSDCPPADRLLEELDKNQSVPGAQAIVISEHVTYWNHQGWRDPYSLDDVDMRQKEYGDRFNLDSVYTPQAVIDGIAQVVGNNGTALAKAVEHAAASPKKTLALGDAHWENGGVRFSVHGTPDANSKLIAVLVADTSDQRVARGENAGRTLHHVAVARAIKEFSSSAADGRVLQLSGGGLAHNQGAAHARLVAFLVEKKTGRVTAVAELTLNG